MGYSTDYSGRLEVEPPLSAAEVSFLTAFSESRRQNYVDGPYCVNEGAELVEDGWARNTPPDGQPGLWCDFTPTEDGTAIVWNGNEKTYDAVKWIRYLIEHFVGENPKAAGKVSGVEFTGHVVNGELEWQGEEPGDTGIIFVETNFVRVERGY